MDCAWHNHQWCWLGGNGPSANQRIDEPGLPNLSQSIITFYWVDGGQKQVTAVLPSGESTGATFSVISANVSKIGVNALGTQGISILLGTAGYCSFLDNGVPVPYLCARYGTSNAPGIRFFNNNDSSIGGDYGGFSVETVWVQTVRLTTVSIN